MGRLIFAILAIVVTTLGLKVGYEGFYSMYGQLELAKEIQLPVHEQADVQSGEAVQPGTFTIMVPFKELNTLAAKSNQRAIVTYGPVKYWVTNSLAGDDEVLLRYWLPRTDVVGTFYYAENVLPMTTHSRTSVIGSVEQKGHTLVVTSKQNMAGATGRLVLATTLLFIAFLMWRHLVVSVLRMKAA